MGHPVTRAALGAVAFMVLVLVDVAWGTVATAVSAAIVRTFMR